MDDTKHLMLVVDIKYGYEDRHLIFKNYIIELDWLYDKNIQNKASKFIFGAKANFPTLDSLLKYKDSPVKLIEEFGLVSFIGTALNLEVTPKYFPEAFADSDSAIVFPELFVIKNPRLLYDYKPDTEDILTNLGNNTIVDTLDTLDDLFDTSNEEVDEDDNHKFDA